MILILDQYPHLDVSSVIAYRCEDWFSPSEIEQVFDSKVGCMAAGLVSNSNAKI